MRDVQPCSLGPVPPVVTLAVVSSFACAATTDPDDSGDCDGSSCSDALPLEDNIVDAVAGGNGVIGSGGTTSDSSGTASLGGSPSATGGTVMMMDAPDEPDEPEPEVPAGHCQVLFTYSAELGPVVVTGPFTEPVEWAESWSDGGISLAKTGPNEWSAVEYMLPGHYQYKFLVDGEWTLDPTKPQEADTEGIMNNYIDVACNEVSL